MPVNGASEVYSQEIDRIHGAIVDFGRLCKKILDNVGTDYKDLTTIPARVTTLLAQKADFDAIGIPISFISNYLGANRGYSNFQVNDLSDFNAVFTKAPGFRTIVVNNISQIPPSYVNNQLSFVTANAGTQTAITNECNDILQHIINL